MNNFVTSGTGAVDVDCGTPRGLSSTDSMVVRVLCALNEGCSGVRQRTYDQIAQQRFILFSELQLPLGWPEGHCGCLVQIALSSHCKHN